MGCARAGERDIEDRPAAAAAAMPHIAVGIVFDKPTALLAPVGIESGIDKVKPDLYRFAGPLAEVILPGPFHWQVESIDSNR